MLGRYRVTNIVWKRNFLVVRRDRILVCACERAWWAPYGCRGESSGIVSPIYLVLQIRWTFTRKSGNTNNPVISGSILSKLTATMYHFNIVPIIMHWACWHERLQQPELGVGGDFWIIFLFHSPMLHIIFGMGLFTPKFIANSCPQLIVGWDSSDCETIYNASYFS